MKRKILYGTFLLLAIALTGCSSGGIKKPNKGKAINELHLKYYDYDNNEKEIHINKNDSFDDVYNNIELMSFQTYSDDKISYAYKTTSKRTINEKNKYYPLYAKLSDEKETYEYSGEHYLFKNYITNDKNTETTFNYYKSDKTYSKGRSVTDFQKTIINDSSINIVAGNYTEGSNKFIYDFAEYDSYKIDEKNEGIITDANNDNKKSVYKYVNKEANQDNRFDRYYGTDKDGTSYTYTLDSLRPNINTMSKYIDLYDKNFTYFYDNKIELTDKYIILKFKSLYTQNMYEEAQNRLRFETNKSAFSNKEISDKLVDLINEEYNGSYTTEELWINYNKKDNDVSNLCFDYYYMKSYERQYKKSKYTREEVDYRYSLSDNDKINSLIGMDYLINNKTTYTYELAINDYKYDKKIESLKNKAKKNNLYDKIEMKVK